MKREREVVVVGAGPVGLAAALDLRLRGVDAVVFDERTSAAEGSRAICFSKRTLEIFRRMGAGGAMKEKGVQWSAGRIFFGKSEVHRFNLQPEAGHAMPAFVNIQQYYCERFLEKRLAEVDSGALRRGVKVLSVECDDNGATLLLRDKSGEKRLRAGYVIACDGAKSGIREAMGLPLSGSAFHDRFLISDVRMLSDFPSERRFWFEPPFHGGQSALLHKQPDNVWRIDLQLGSGADAELERRPERVRPRLRAMLGENVRFEIVWVSVYAFQARRISRFVHGRIIFAGDSAHQVSPFGARGANSGIEDGCNLCWKLAAVVKRGAPQSLLRSYDIERRAAADENIRHSVRSTNFIAPQTCAARAFRDAVLQLARKEPFAGALINSGRLSSPAVLNKTPLNAADCEGALGEVCPDAPLKINGRNGWLLDELGADFTVLQFAGGEDAGGINSRGLPVCFLRVGKGGARDIKGLASGRLQAAPGECFLVRPDGHICARYKGAGAADACLKIAGKILQKGRAC